MDQRLSVVTLGVADLERSRRFYESLGWERGNSEEEIVFFQMNSSIVALFPREHLAADAQVPSEGDGFRGLTLAWAGAETEEGRKSKPRPPGEPGKPGRKASQP